MDFSFCFFLSKWFVCFLYEDISAAHDTRWSKIISRNMQKFKHRCLSAEEKKMLNRSIATCVFRLISVTVFIYQFRKKIVFLYPSIIKNVGLYHLVLWKTLWLNLVLCAPMFVIPFYLLLFRVCLCVVLPLFCLLLVHKCMCIKTVWADALWVFNGSSSFSSLCFIAPSLAGNHHFE